MALAVTPEVWTDNTVKQSHYLYKMVLSYIGLWYSDFSLVWNWHMFRRNHLRNSDLLQAGWVLCVTFLQRSVGAVGCGSWSVPGSWHVCGAHCESRSVCTYNGLFYILQPSPYQFVSLKWFVANHFSKSTRIKIENQQSSCCSPRVSRGSVKDLPCPEDIFLTNEWGKILVYKQLSCISVLSPHTPKDGLGIKPSIK